MININDFDYYLPPNLIANAPAVPRDSSKLLIYNTKKDEVFFDRFIHLDQYLPEKSFLVLNNTKVIPARIDLKKENGGKVTVLFLVNEISSNPPIRRASPPIRRASIQYIRGYVDRKVEIGDKLYFDTENYAEAIKQEESIFTFQLNFSYEKLFKLLEKMGTMPIPLYIKNTPLNREELKEKYQTIFANLYKPARFGKGGSAAAPTASLHFTKRVFNKLKRKEIEKFFITLHVGLGTFAPIDEKNIQEKKLHKEWFEVDENTLRLIETKKKNGEKLVAVGTTVTRTLESLKFPIFDNQYQITNNTDLFIFPPYNFQMVDCLITNFHLPKSSLMMLVEAFLQYKGAKKSLIDLYKMAIEKKYRFYSFGDVMLII